MKTQEELNEYIEDLNNDTFTIKDFEQFCVELKDNTKVTYIDLGKLSLLEGGTKGRAGVALGSLLAKNITLTHLDLNSTHITADDIKLLVDGLTQNPQSALISLGLSDAEVDNAFDDCIESLFSINSLHHLDLCFAHEVNAVTVKAIGQGLKNNTTLKSLVLPIINNDLVYIFQSLEQNKTLKSLDMSKSSIDERGMEDLKIMLERNKSLTSLICRYMNSGEYDSDKGLSALGLQYLLEGMQSNFRVIHLDLSGSVDAASAGVELSAINTLLERNKQQLDIITSIDKGINSPEEGDDEYKLKAYLNKAKTQLDDKHPDKETVIKNINTKIETLSLKRPAGDHTQLPNKKFFKTG